MEKENKKLLMKYKYKIGDKLCQLNNDGYNFPAANNNIFTISGYEKLMRA